MVEQQRLERRRADLLRTLERGLPVGASAEEIRRGGSADHAEPVVRLDDAGVVTERRAQLERLFVAGRGLVEETTMALDVADVHERRRDGALVAELAPRLERGRRAIERLFVAREQPQHLPDVVERTGHAARVTGLLEEVVPALQVLERDRELGLLPVDAAYLVEGHGRLGARRDDPRQAQHPLERAERRVEVALQLEDRAEVVPEVDAAREIAVAEAAERGGVEAHRLVVEVASARAIASATVAEGSPGPVARALEVAADLFLLLFAATARVQLEPLRDEAVIAASPIIVDAAP